MTTAKKPPLLLVTGALALGALGVSLLIKALFFPSDPQPDTPPGMVQEGGRPPGSTAPPSAPQR